MLCHRVVIVTLLAVSFAVTTIAPSDLKPADSRKTAPDFSLEDSSGALIKLSGYKGRVVLLDFWATWCTGCKQEIPWYMEFQDKYKKDGLSEVRCAGDMGRGVYGARLTRAFARQAMEGGRELASNA